MSMQTTPTTARVQTRSAFLSKVNWTQVGAAAMMIITTNALGFDDATQVKVMAATTLAQSILTVVFKTWFTNTVAPQSLPSDPPRA